MLLIEVSGCHRAPDSIVRLDLPAPEHVSIIITDGEGQPVRQLLSDAALAKGRHTIPWDGHDLAGNVAPPGEYHWSGVAHQEFRVKLRAMTCFPGEPRSEWGAGGVPSAVAADAARVYLGWRGSLRDARVVAVDSAGDVQWSTPLAGECIALSRDGDWLYVLERQNVRDVVADRVVRLRARDGSEGPWPESSELQISALWPADAKARPGVADAMSARAGQLYLTFTDLEFLAVLDAKTGGYLQTVVGGMPGAIDVTPTKTGSADRPGELVPADFAAIAMRGGALGKVLFARDPLWVIASDIQPLARAERITAVTLIGDGAPHHPHSMFVGLEAPFQQVQRRSILESQGFLWSAGRSGGRTLGPWQADALGPIGAVALDGQGNLWVAESDASPPRFSVWSTYGNAGRLVREIFGPVPPDQTGTAMLPGDPNLIIGAGCEWRVDPNSSAATCLGVITHRGMMNAEFIGRGGKSILLVTHADGAASVFERRGAGDYALLAEHQPGDPDLRALDLLSRPDHQLGQANVAKTTLTFGANDKEWQVTTLEGLLVARLFTGTERLQGIVARGAAELHLARRPAGGSVTQTADGRIFATAIESALWSMEITGCETVRTLNGGALVRKRNSEASAR